MSGILNGVWTVTSPTGEHRTFRVSTWKTAEKETRSVALLSGPDNTQDYVGFGFVLEDGTIRVFKKFSDDSQYSKLAATLADLFKGEKSRRRAQGMRIEGAACCRRCNRLLTTPESIAAQMGPECSKK
jgi:hypothetical protein